MPRAADGLEQTRNRRRGTQRFRQRPITDLDTIGRDQIGCDAAERRGQLVETLIRWNANENAVQKQRQAETRGQTGSRLHAMLDAEFKSIGESPPVFLAPIPQIVIRHGASKGSVPVDVIDQNLDLSGGHSGGV